MSTPSTTIITTTRFDEDLRLAADPGAPGRFGAEVAPHWSSLRGVHGGFLAALAVRAAEVVAEGRAVRTATTAFLRPARPGPVEVQVEVVRSGRSLSTLVATVRQDGRDITTSRITALVPAVGTTWERPSPHDLPPVERCEPLAPPEGVRHFENATAALDPSHLPFTGGEQARVGGHVRPLEPRPVDAPWLTMLLDWFPPASFTRNDPPTGGVSVDYTVHLHRTLPVLGAEEWLSGVFTADLDADGLALEQGTVRDPIGRVIAESFHTRWTA